MEEDVGVIWSRIEKWCEKNAPQSAGALHGPANPAAVRALSDLMGSPLPDDYLQSLLRHDGGGSIHNFDYLDAKWSASVWHRMQDQQGAGHFEGAVPADDSGSVFKPVWWHALWLPVAEHRAGTLICLDLDPGERGARGQVLRLELQDEGASVAATSFAVWLAQYAEALEAENYAVDASANLNPKPP